MFRHLLLFPRSADPAEVDRVVALMASRFQGAEGFRSMTVSVDALMGPSAREGAVGRVVVADFETLDTALAVLDTTGFDEVRAMTERLAPDIFLFEVTDV